MLINEEFTDIENKLEKICIDNELEYKFETITFPVVATVKQNQTKKNQMVLDEMEQPVKNFGDIKFIFDEELQVSISDNFTIADEVLNKLKNNFKKLHYVYLQIYFKMQKEKGTR